VLHAIGSGGHDAVCAAQQIVPGVTVAIAAPRMAAFVMPEILKRFKHEAEMLGRLQHPGIAQVFAFNPGDRRVPAQLVMELVTGPPVTEYVQAHGLGLAARIHLMIAVCEAVQHAHDRGIVHRDLEAGERPGFDQPAEGVDFGIARATGPDMHSTLQAAHGQLLGTLAYELPNSCAAPPARSTPAATYARSA
jgi:non-specific serine/threonine protein kinase/serine/threonine-protein kinase